VDLQLKPYKKQERQKLTGDQKRKADIYSNVVVYVGSYVIIKLMSVCVFGIIGVKLYFQLKCNKTRSN
jgi:hypothetical protein